MTDQQEFLFEDAGTLEFGEAFQLITRKAAQKIKYQLSVYGNCVPKKSGNERRARGDSGQN
jgi:hypothetical protein